jgi:hypothetical protein
MHLPAYLPRWLKSAAEAIFHHVDPRPLAFRDTLPDQSPPAARRHSARRRSRLLSENDTRRVAFLGEDAMARSMLLAFNLDERKRRRSC